MSRSRIRRVTDPAELLQLYGRNRGAHPYALADIDLFWDASVWWCHGDSALGMIVLDGLDMPVIYAVPTTTAADMLILLVDVVTQGHLPDRFICTGPRDTAPALHACGYLPEWSYDYVRLDLKHRAYVPEPAADVVHLDSHDVADLETLYGKTMDAPAFFHGGLVENGHYVGRRLAPAPSHESPNQMRPGVLVAAAGTHIISTESSVAAIGNVATHPGHRRHGHAKAVVATLIREQLGTFRTIGLNVRSNNPGAQALYQSMGFEPVVDYAEGLFSRSAAQPQHSGSATGLPKDSHG